MKDKRTYKTRKEHRNDMSYENEASITNKDRGESSLTLLIENYKKEIWEWKQKESQWVVDRNQLEGNKKIIEELTTKMVEIGKVNLTLQSKAIDAEGETSIVKAVGINSPEMKELQAKVKKLESNRPLNTMDEVGYRELQVKIEQLESTLKSAQEINDSHQRYNGKLFVRLAEVEEDNKKLSKQIEDMNKRRAVL